VEVGRFVWGAKGTNMTTPYLSLDGNIQSTTRALFLKSIKPQVIMQMPLLARLWMAKKVTWEGGTVIKQPVQKATMASLLQPYVPTDGLNTGAKTLLNDPYFHWKYAQLPVQYNIEQHIQNGGSADTAPVKLVPFLVKEAVRGMKIGLYRMIYGIDSTGTDYDHKKEFNSCVDALTHDRTYGHLARSTTLDNDTYAAWWQGASIAASFADQATAITASIASFRKAMAAINTYDQGLPGGKLCCVGPTIFQALQSEVEARHIYNRDGSLLAKYGFNTLMLDGVEIVQDNFLTNAVQTNAHKKFFIYTVDDWELRIHPERNINLTPFVWQGDRDGGRDEWLARVMIAGNLVCWKPNGSIYLTNMA
jgi:hypothetical protein